MSAVQSVLSKHHCSVIGWVPLGSRPLAHVLEKLCCLVSIISWLPISPCCYLILACIIFGLAIYPDRHYTLGGTISGCTLQPSGQFDSWYKSTDSEETPTPYFHYRIKGTIMRQMRCGILVWVQNTLDIQTYPHSTPPAQGSVIILTWHLSRTITPCLATGNRKQSHGSIFINCTCWVPLLLSAILISLDKKCSCWKYLKFNFLFQILLYCPEYAPW